MLSSVTAKIKSARKYWRAGVLALVLVLASTLLWSIGTSGELRLMQAGDYEYRLEVASTPDQHESGLSGREALARDRGMLFVYDREGWPCFWMKDTLIPLDIIWLDAQRSVVHIEEYVSPETYPASFCPDAPAQYVIELNAGEAARAGIGVGQTLDF